MIHEYHLIRQGGDCVAVINLRDFQDSLHREAKAKAALEGITLKGLIINAVEEYLKTGKKRIMKLGIPHGLGF
jgi:hypothetical protein